MKKNRWLISLILGLAAFSLVTPTFASTSPQEATVKEILDNPDSYDQREVKVAGKAVNLKLKVSKKGNAYTTFSLMDKDYKTLKVFMWGHQDVRDGDRIEVTGTFRKVKYVGRYKFYNEIEAERIEKLK
ncbi:hypothetical protein ES705_29066 [subsurface metagenome]|jgi:hypothetical protein